MADDRSERGRGRGASESPGPGAPAARRTGMLARALVVLAVLLMGAGLALGLLYKPEVPPPRETSARTAQEDLPPGMEPGAFLPGDRSGDRPRAGDATPDAETAEGEAPENPWSPAVFRLGFSFFIGFAIAFALRSFIKLTLVAAGFFAMALLGMQYAGFIEVNWTLIEGRYDTAGAWIAGQFDSFQNFVTGELPAAASALAGLAFGFRAR